MADEITVRHEAPPTHPEGQYQAVCVDVIDLGEKLEQFQNQPPEIVPKVVVVWQSKEIEPRTGKRYEIAKEYTKSFGRKSNLRKDLGNWRGKSYDDAEAQKGIPLHRLTGVNCFLTIEHKTSGSGNTYARVTNIMPIVKDVMKPMQAEGYERAEFWAKRKQEYADRVAEFRAKAAPPSDEEFAAATAVDNLPF
ncbi:MAG TPA: hypothetical protein VFQ22_07710 [Longimicrobiales bacterium]|nr:hypothetical protein [Longimicrobiales bacterium]